MTTKQIKLKIQKQLEKIKKLFGALIQAKGELGALKKELAEAKIQEKAVKKEK
jgi:hypothetical protein